jgi:hypothetical protein
MKMENRIRQWLEDLDLFSIKSEDEMKLAYHRFISGCNADGLDAKGWENLADLKQFVKHNNVPLKTVDCKPKKIRSIYHAMKTCSSEDESRKVLFGFYIPENQKTIVSTDGRRLLILPYSGSLPAGNWDLYQGKALKMLEKMTYDEYKSIMASDNATHPIYSNVVKDFCDLIYADGFWFQKTEGVYPNYMSVIPDEKNRVHAGELTKDWIAGLKSCLHLQKLLYGKKSADGGVVGLSLQDDCFIDINGEFLNDCFEILPQFCGNETVKFEVSRDNAEYGPFMFSTKSGALYVQMPMRGGSNHTGYIINQMQLLNGKWVNTAPAAPVHVEPAKAESPAPEVPAIVESNIIVARPAPIETPASVSEPEVPADVPSVPVKPVVRFTPGLPDSNNDAPEESPIETGESKPPVGSKYARTQEERMVNNLKFEQMTIYNGIRRMESRLAFIHRILDDGEKLSPSMYTDKKGKPHYVVNKNFMGKTAYEYAERLLNGGGRITA